MTTRRHTHGESDEILMERFCATLDEDLFRILAERHYGRALRVAQERLGTYALAQDAVQAAMVKVVRYRKRYKPSRSFSAWFYTILRNVCTDIYRKEARRREMLAGYAEAVAVREPVSRGADRARDIIGGLPPHQARLLALRFEAGMTFREMADHLDCSVDAVKKQFQRLIQRLKK